MSDTQAQWRELMERRYEAGLERTVVTDIVDDEPRVRIFPGVETMSDQERYEDSEVFCRYCGFYLHACECDSYIDGTDYTR